MLEILVKHFSYKSNPVFRKIVAINTASFSRNTVSWVADNCSEDPGGVISLDYI